MSVPVYSPSFACIRCFERKVKCNKQNPCNACVRHGVQCIFRPPKSSRRKRESAKDKLVDERLKRYEALLREKGVDPNQVPGIAEAENHPNSSRLEVSEAVWKSPPEAVVFKPQLLHGQGGTELVDNILWSRVVEEVHDADDALGEDSVNDESDGEISNDDFDYVLGWNSSSIALSHPPAELIYQLWQTFIENVNPLTKIVHVPTLQPAMEKAITNIQHVPRGFEALMFSMYSMAVLSLTEEECSKLLGEPRTTLLPRYVAATKVALSRARFMSSTSIVVLQAMVLHILSIRDACEPRTVWSLTGVAIRIAEGMGMRLDGTLLGLSPFESEIRRRIWWQLKMHDFRAAELCGQAKFREFKLDETTPKNPANINDTDMYPAMPRAATESNRPTEMIWCVFRSDLASFAASQIARLNKKAVSTSDECSVMNDLKIKDTYCSELEEMIETKYLRFCDPSQPLQLMVLLGARCATNIFRFLAYHPRRWATLNQVPASERQLVWGIVIQLLEQYKMMQSSPELRRFAWNVPYFIQWHVVIHVLDTLRVDPLHIDAVKAWRLIDTLYENNSESLLSIKRPIFVAVGSLCLKAFKARTAALEKERRCLPSTPEYITKLQEQREAAKSRRAVATRGKGSQTFDGGKRLTTTETDVSWPDTNSSSAEAWVEAQQQQHPVAKQPANLVQGGTQTGDDAFWLSEALDGGSFAGGAADMMNLDTDAILTQDYWLDTPTGEVIDWAQWDAWLGNLDSTRINPGMEPL